MDVRVILHVCLIKAAVLTHLSAANTNGTGTVCETYAPNFSVPVCTGCLNYTGLDAESICTDCEDIHCIVCNDGLSQNCTQCEAGYGLSSASFVCQPCLNPNCSSCLESQSGLLDECVGCKNDLVLHTGTAPAICLVPESNCSNHSSTELVSGTTTPVCYTCNTGFFLTQTGDCQLCVVDSCSRCFNSTHCAQCASGYGLNNGNCTVCQDILCDECASDGDTCISCLTGYGVGNSSTCQACPSNCERCAGNNSVALACQAGGCTSGYSLRDNTTLCRPCQIEHCAECADADDTGTVRCTKCLQGASLSEDGTQCLDCTQQDTWCTSCEASLACIACPDGYILRNGQCIESCFVCDEAEDCGSPGGANRYHLVTCPHKPCYVSRFFNNIIFCINTYTYVNNELYLPISNLEPFRHHRVLQHQVVSRHDMYLCLSQVSVTGNGQTGNATYERGCAPFRDCSDDRALGVCSLDEHGTMLCSRCCTGPGCNTYSVNLLNLNSNSPVMKQHSLPQFILLLSVVHFIFS